MSLALGCAFLALALFSGHLLLDCFETFLDVLLRDAVTDVGRWSLLAVLFGGLTAAWTTAAFFSFRAFRTGIRSSAWLCAVASLVGGAALG